MNRKCVDTLANEALNEESGQIPKATLSRRVKRERQMNEHEA